MNPVFVTGGTGYIGRLMIQALLARGFEVHALVRRESVDRLPPGARAAIGNALDETTFVDAIPPRATLVHLVGTPHPNPSKAAEFRRVDLVSVKAAVRAARQAHVEHFVYVSVAQPAPVMKEYIAVRQEGEAFLKESGLRATILRPWYILGPGHWWPCLLLPLYAVLRLFPGTRAGAERLGLVTHRTMIDALVRAIESPPIDTVRTMEVPDIRRAAI